MIYSIPGFDSFPDVKIIDPVTREEVRFIRLSTEAVRRRFLEFGPSNCAEQCSAGVIRNYAIRVTAFPLCSIYSVEPCICLGAHVTDDIGAREGPGAKGCDS